MNENQNGSSRDRRESRDKKLFQNEKVNEIFINLRIFHFFYYFFICLRVVWRKGFLN